jgi:hypothetical protein
MQTTLTSVPYFFLCFVQELQPLRAINYQAVCLSLYATYHFSVPSLPTVKSYPVEHRLPLYRAVVALHAPKLGEG